MAFISTIPEELAAGATATMYQRAKETFGYVPNMTKVFSHRPEVMAAWSALLTSIKDKMDARRYELVTIAAAKALRSSYCMLAHGSVLLRDFYAAGDLQAIIEDPERAELTETDKAIMRFAQKVASDAAAVTESDVEDLRQQGLSDEQIFDVAAAAAVRCFFSKTLDALGAQPDSAYNEISGSLKELLAVGRPIEP